MGKYILGIITGIGFTVFAGFCGVQGYYMGKKETLDNTTMEYFEKTANGENPNDNQIHLVRKTTNKKKKEEESN